MRVAAVRLKAIAFPVLVSIGAARGADALADHTAQVQIEAHIAQVTTSVRFSGPFTVDFAFKNVSGATQTGTNLTLIAPANFALKGYAFDGDKRAVRCDETPGAGSVTDNVLSCLVVSPWVDQDDLSIRLRLTPEVHFSAESFEIQAYADYSSATAAASKDFPFILHPLSTTGPKLAIEKYAEDVDSDDGYGPIDHLHTGDVFWYEIDVYNDSTVPSSGPVTITDALPPGLIPLEVYAYDATADEITCSLDGSTVSCTRQAPIAKDHRMSIDVLVQVTAETGDITNQATVSGGGDSPHDSNISTYTVNPATLVGTCVADALTACLLDNVFQQRLVWFATDIDESGVSFVQPLTSDTTAHSFFTPNNIDLVTKVVDGRAVNGFYWLFGGGLTDVGYLLQTVNVFNGDRNWVFNTPKHLSSYAFTDAFRGSDLARVFADPRSVACEVETPGGLFKNADLESFPESAASPAAVAPCVANATTLCLNGGRFKVTAHWEAVKLGTSGEGQAGSITTDTGTFWFFTSNNIELVIKVVDGRAVNGKYWVFYGALSNIKYTITVTDTQSGIVKTYVSQQDTQASIADTSAFLP